MKISGKTFGRMARSVRRNMPDQMGQIQGDFGKKLAVIMRRYGMWKGSRGRVVNKRGFIRYEK